MSIGERIIELFAQHSNEYVSGEELSSQLGCSRTAVWKHIQALKQEGFKFEAVRHRGYRLIGSPVRMDLTKLALELNGCSLGHKIVYEREVVSTQNMAAMLIAQGAPEGTLVIAEMQTSGRGRRGRPWFSPPGKGIWMSLILKPQIPLAFMSHLTLLISVSLCRTIRKLTGAPAGIKWPNDLLIEGKKISGILLESTAEDERVRHVIAGIGISANLELKDYPKELREVATSIKIATGQQVDREQLIAQFLLDFDSLYSLYLEQGFDPIRSLWEAQSVTLNRLVKLHSASGILEGIAIGIDDFGALMIQTEAGIQKAYSGDISVRSE